MGRKDPNLDMMLSTDERGMLNILGKTTYRHTEDEPGKDKQTWTDVWFIYERELGKIRTFMLRDGSEAKREDEGAGRYRVLVDDALPNPFYKIINLSVVKRHKGLAQLQASANAYNKSQNESEDDEIRIGRCIDVHNPE
jgi:hypothetical protein